MSVLVVLPTLDPVAARECVATMSPELVANLLIVENGASRMGHTGAGRGHYRPPPHSGPLRPKHNIGVSRTMNHAIDEMTRHGCDLLVWVSTSMRFGDDGGRRLIEVAGGEELGVVAQGPVAWHAVAIRPLAFRLAGRWDENYFPGYYEDADWRYRLSLATGLPALPQHDIGGRAVDGRGYDMLRAANPGRQVVNFDALKAYHLAKWGGVPPHSPEVFTHPFNDPTLPVDYWEPVTRDVLIDRFGLGQ